MAVFRIQRFGVAIAVSSLTPNENVRRESKLSVPDHNEETLVAQTPGIPDISIHIEPEIKGGLKTLQQKGLKITNYKEDIPRPRKK